MGIYDELCGLSSVDKKAIYQNYLELQLGGKGDTHQPILMGIYDELCGLSSVDKKAIYQNYLELQLGGKRVNPHEHR